MAALYRQWTPSEKAKVIFQRWGTNVSKDTLTLKDLRFVVKALKTLSPRWEDIGMSVDVKDLDGIKKNYRGTYKRLIAVINSWLSGNYNPERDGSNAPSWWKIVDVVADDIGGANPNLAKNIAQNWEDLGKDDFSPLAMSTSSTPLECCEGSTRLIAEIARELHEVAANWFEVATLLGVPVNKLNSIKEECEYNTEACLKGAIKEWLSGQYTETSLRVLVGVVEHQAGGANPSLAKDLAKMTFQDKSTTGGGTNGAEGTSGSDEIAQHIQTDQRLPALVHHPKEQQHPCATQGADGLQEALHRSLAMKDLFEITHYIRNMDDEQLIRLGDALGLHHPSLKRMKTLPDDMVAAWLLRQDNVLDRDGGGSEPTYERLAVALEAVSQKGLAKDVREQKYAKRTPTSCS